jgi:DNA mismatch repair ATPase MutL
LLDSAKVRKDLALKGSAKCLAKIKHLIQAYAIARPTIRFRLHVLKAKNSRSDFIYAPKTNANVEDAALKIIGKECALQCDWTAFEWEGFELHAFLPKPTAIGYKVSNHGAFISIDSRPVSSVRGTLKKIAAAVKDKMRKASPALANVKDPFFSLNITCPMGSYDPNIEPAKNDVIFCEECSVLAAVNRLLNSYYLESIDSIDLVTESGLRDTSPIQPNHLPSGRRIFRSQFFTLRSSRQAGRRFCHS